MVAGPGYVIDPPSLTPPPNGLLNSALVIDHDDELHWGNQLDWAAEPGGDATVTDPCSATARDNTRNRAGNRSFVPFIADAYDQCSTFGFAEADYEGRARRMLAARETKAVEKEFWAKTLATAAGWPNNGLAEAGAVVYGGGVAQSLRYALALLCQAASELNAGQAMIHARPFIVQLWQSLQMLRADGTGPNAKLRTAQGHLVVPGVGYPGTGPAGQAITATSEWAFVTDPVVVHRGPVEVFTPFTPGGEYMAIDRTNNTVEISAQRLEAPIFNGICLATVQINPSNLG